MITSQNATAPKRVRQEFKRDARLITSQNATAPKPEKLARLGFETMFLKPVGKKGVHTADSLINGEAWEIKQPVGDKNARTIEKTPSITNSKRHPNRVAR